MPTRRPQRPRPPEPARRNTARPAGDNVSTDEILPGGNEALPLRSNVPAISECTFAYVEKTFPARAKAKSGGLVVAGDNFRVAHEGPGVGPLTGEARPGRAVPADPRAGRCGQGPRRHRGGDAQRGEARGEPHAPGRGAHRA